MKFKMLDGTGTVDLKYVEKNRNRHGGVRYYVRVNGERLGRLEETPGTQAFVDEHRALLAGEPKPGAAAPAPPPKRRPAPWKSYDWVCQEYFKSADFTGLGPTTRSVRRARLEEIGDRDTQEGKLGRWPISAVLARHLLQIRDEMADTPEAANERIKALRQLFKWAKQPALDYVKVNPALDVPYLKSKNPGGFHEWTEGEMALYETCHLIGTKARLAFDLFQYTTARISDVVRMGPPMERSGELHWTEHKGRGSVEKQHELPVVPALRASIDATPSGHLVYIVTEFGKPFSEKGFGNWFKKRCVEAGLPHCSAHGIRKRANERIADNGGTVHGMMALNGWTTEKQAIHYTRKADRRRLEKATAPLLEARSRNETATPDEVMAPGVAKTAKKS